MRVDILETELFSRYFSDVIGKNDLLPVKGVSTDSRDIKKGDLFLAIKGENFDGSEFVGEALSAGATYAIVQSGDEIDFFRDKYEKGLESLKKYKYV